MAGTVLWWSVLCATVSALSAAGGMAVLAKDQVREHRLAKIWFILHIITASLAATYYSKVVRWQRVAQLRQYHGNFLWLSRVLGVPIMSAHLTDSALGLKNASQVLAGVGIAVFAIGCCGVRHRQLVTSVANWLVIAVMAVLCCLHRSVAGVSWVLLLSFSLLTGTHGSAIPLWRGWSVPRIDLCHLLVAGCNVALVYATPAL